MRPQCCALLVVVLGGCGGEGVQWTYEVQHYQVPCTRTELQLCRLVREESLSDFSRFFDPIDGWAFEWGIVSTLQVTERKRLSSGEDRLSVYFLDAVVSEVAVEPGTTFGFPYRPSEETEETQVVVASGAGGTLLDGRAFTCLDEVVCDELDGVIGSRETVVLTFAYADPIDDPLILRAVDVTTTTTKPDGP